LDTDVCDTETTDLDRCANDFTADTILPRVRPGYGS